jgi:hypothetical protein
MNAHPSPLGLGLFPLPDAARLAQIDPRTAQRWAEGYPFTYKGEKRISRPVMPLALERIDGRRDLTFAELLTLRLVKAFKTAGLGLPTIKRVAERAATDFGLAMPFVSRRFRTDGRKVFVELQREPAANDEPAPTRSRKNLTISGGSWWSQSPPMWWICSVLSNGYGTALTLSHNSYHDCRCHAGARVRTRHKGDMPARRGCGEPFSLWHGAASARRPGRRYVLSQRGGQVSPFPSMAPCGFFCASAVPCGATTMLASTQHRGPSGALERSCYYVAN